jgi:cell division protein FtsQ
VHGLVRVGERRWDLVLDREQRILLPERGAVQALERVIALENAEEVLTRDVMRVDLRLAQRPTVRMSESATATWWDIKEASGQ